MVNEGPWGPMGDIGPKWLNMATIWLKMAKKSLKMAKICLKIAKNVSMADVIWSIWYIGNFYILKIIKTEEKQ